MDEDAPSLTIALIINSIIFIVIPFVLAYRRGYFFNFGEHLYWTKNLFKRKNQVLPTDWTIVGIRQLSAFEKQQIRKITIKLIPFENMGYRAIIILKSNKTLDYPFGGNKGYWIDDEINKENILIRTWQKGNFHKYDIIPIIDHE